MQCQSYLQKSITIWIILMNNFLFISYQFLSTGRKLDSWSFLLASHHFREILFVIILSIYTLNKMIDNEKGNNHYEALVLLKKTSKKKKTSKTIQDFVVACMLCFVYINLLKFIYFAFWLKFPLFPFLLVLFLHFSLFLLFLSLCSWKCRSPMMCHVFLQ